MMLCKPVVFDGLMWWADVPATEFRVQPSRQCWSLDLKRNLGFFLSLSWAMPELIY